MHTCTVDLPTTDLSVCANQKKCRHSFAELVRMRSAPEGQNFKRLNFERVGRHFSLQYGRYRSCRDDYEGHD